jgi:hypothetical protein
MRIDGVGLHRRHRRHQFSECRAPIPNVRRVSAASLTPMSIDA